MTASATSASVKRDRVSPDAEIVTSNLPSSTCPTT
jgi:hypothetical protein